MKSTTAPQLNLWTQRQIGHFKPLVFLVCLLPFLRWLYLGFEGGLGANPAEFLIRSSGYWALVGLLLTLTVTPLRRWVGQPALVSLRRMLGLFAWFYAALHLAGWMVWEVNLSPVLMLDDIIQRTFILLGMLAFIPMTLLAITSTRGWIRRLKQRWQKLHRVVYAVAILGVWHFWLVRDGKNDTLEPWIFAIILAALLAARLVHRFKSMPSVSPASAHRACHRGASAGSAAETHV